MKGSNLVIMRVGLLKVDGFGKTKSLIIEYRATFQIKKLFDEIGNRIDILGQRMDSLSEIG